MKKKVVSLLIIINILINISSIAYAGDLWDIYNGASGFIQSGSSGVGVINQEKVQYVSNSIYNVLLIIGICVATIVIVILGIKFIMGSVEEKSQIKELLVPFIIGCVVVFGAFAIWKFIVVIGNYITV